MKRYPKVGDLVRYENPEETGFAVERLGFVTDVMEFNDGSYPMYEVVCTDPYDRGWFSDTALEVVSETRGSS